MHVALHNVLHIYSTRVAKTKATTHIRAYLDLLSLFCVFVFVSLFLLVFVFVGHLTAG